LEGTWEAGELAAGDRDFPATKNKTGGDDMAKSRLLIATIVLLSALFCFSSASAQTNDRAQAVMEFEGLLGKIQALENRLLAVSNEDKAAFAGFLKQSNTGLIRLLPRDKYDRKLAISGGGAYYSFVRLTHEYGRGSDIELSEGSFRVGFAGVNYGFLGLLGDMPLDSVSLDHPGVAFLTEFKPPSAEAEVRAVGQKTYNGFQSGDYNYKRYLTAVPEKTYVLRSIDYHEGYDVLIAFHVVRRDTDGSLVIVWKKLKDFQPPHLERQ
jgi:hypothetical protein